MIDYSFKEKQNEAMNIRRFIQKQENEKHKKMMKNIEEHFSKIGKVKVKEDSSEKKRKRRMKEARKRFQKEDGKE